MIVHHVNLSLFVSRGEKNSMPNNPAYQEYEKWLQKADESLKEELKAIKNSPEEIEKRFHKELSFGTGGIRGIIGAGTAMMNIHVVRRATQGLANYGKKISKADSAVICYDTRKFSREFAVESAKVLMANGFRVYVFDESRPTPMLSFAVRELKVDWGIVITASHNPPQYNGFKVYLSNGVQATPEFTNGISAEIEKLDYFDDVKVSESEPLWLNADEFDEVYLKELQKFLKGFNTDDVGLKVLYTPLHGSGFKPVSKALKFLGIDFQMVDSQVTLDGAFPTVSRPNPEEREAFEEALKFAEKSTNSFDLIIATDPDCDRMGVMYRKDEKYELLTGNEIGVLILDYLLNSTELKENSFVVKTIVTTDLVKPMCEERDIELLETLTGFKFIGQKIEEKVSSGGNFLFAFEESYGYLAGDFVRDKDGIIASVLMVLTFNWLKKQDKSPKKKLNELSEKYGYFKEILLNFEFEPQGFEKIIQNIMRFFRNSPPESIGSLALTKTIDHLKLKNELSGDVLQLIYGDNLRVIVRPSGTEPKLKIYVKVNSNSEKTSVEILENSKQILRKTVEKISLQKF
ncbi:MAG: phosphoglucomutase [Thermotogaceae bacterium]|nr:phosphoglucomutase [Thermotogaceae bacterium]MDN5338170.1 phosphoglucomutase [Thermotogaceae bacterium]